jgi:hypothetical protein
MFRRVNRHTDLMLMQLRVSSSLPYQCADFATLHEDDSRVDSTFMGMMTKWTLDTRDATDGETHHPHHRHPRPASTPLAESQTDQC